MKKSVLVLLAIVVSSLTLKAQFYFNREVSIPVSKGGPLRMPWAGGINYPLFSQLDFNNDGLKDLFVFDRSDNRVTTYLNNGNAGSDCWVYAPEYENAFPPMTGWAFLYDYNCDDKPDLLTVGPRNNSISQYVNDSPVGGLHFSIADSTILMHAVPFPTNVFASSFLMPNFNDIDNDGDMDIIGQQFQCVGAFAYYRNHSMEDYGVCDSLNDYELETYSWGKFALRSGAYSTVAVGFYNINCFAAGQPSFDMSVAAPQDDTYANIFTIDIDADGDKDALIGDSQAHNSLLVVNGGTPTNAFMTDQDTLFPSYDVPVDLQSFSQHSYVDVDNDQIRDLVVGNYEYENNQGCLYYKNVGTDAGPIFSHVQNDFLQDQMIDVGEAAAPVVVDYNNDGLLDIIIGNKSKTINPSTYTVSLTLYKNVGTPSAPAFEFVTDDFAGLAAIHLQGKIAPAFGDLDGDGDLDMLLGEVSGNLIYVKNDSGNYVVLPGFYSGIDVGNASTVQIFDVNNDGLLDLVVGEQSGVLNYFQNVGTSTSAFFAVAPTVTPFGGIILSVSPAVDAFTSAHVFRQNNDTKMLATGMHGEVLLYGNIDGNLSGSFTLLDTVLEKVDGNRYGYLVSLAGGDLNDDGKEDMVLGLFGGGLQAFYQSTINAAVEMNNSEMVSVYPNPASSDCVIRLSESEQSATFELLNMQGKKVRSGKVLDRYAVINTEKLAAGVYFLQVHMSDKNSTVKLVVTH